MARDASVNTDAPDEPVPQGPFARVLRMQTKLHRWAAADPGRRFDDLFNLVHDPAHAVGGVASGRGQHRGQVCRCRRPAGR